MGRKESYEFFYDINFALLIIIKIIIIRIIIIITI